MSDDLAIAIQILGDLVQPDPWEHSYEGLDDCCHFCGSDTDWWGPPPGRPNWDRQGFRFHRDDCAWIRGMDFLGRQRDGHHLLLSERPEWLVQKTPYAERFMSP